jgi:hypothetical protein
VLSFDETENTCEPGVMLADLEKKDQKLFENLVAH